MSKPQRSPWFWVPSLYYAEGLPYIVVMTVSVIMYKRLGISNTDIALYTSWLYLPWVIKPLWSPVVDILKTKRWWIVTMQLFLGAGFAGVAFMLPLPFFFQATLAFLWLMAFSSATHDIAADGFYMLGLSEHDQAWFVGVRSTFYRFAMITGQGLLIILAGYLESATGLPPVENTVISSPQETREPMLHPDSVVFGQIPGEAEVLIVPSELTISTVPLPKSRLDSMAAFVEQWNEQNNLVEQGEDAATAAKQEAAAAEDAGWLNSAQASLEEFIRTWFGEEQTLAVTGDRAGNTGVFYLRLSQKPPADDPVVVNFGRSEGDKSISLVSEGRFVFTEENWDVPAMALIQLDPKLKEESNAVFEAQSGNIPLAWSITFFIMAGMFVLFFIYHKFVLPYPAEDKAARRSENFLHDFWQTFLLFFKKKRITAILAFLLLYRFAEAQIVKMASPFLLDMQEAGGLALTTGEVGFVYGTVGLIFLTIGGLIGGFVAAKQGLKFWLWPMAIAINLPNLVYVVLSYTLTDSFFWINVAVAIEQFGYGFGFTAYMLYMIYVSQGEHKTAHFAITTAFMALGMMIPGMFSGWLQELIGYQHFFVWVMIATIPAFLVLRLIPLDPEFGKKKDES